jgi:DNA (cytosine-5)-methyltransferase 1
VLLSLFCGAGGLDIGFEAAGFDIGLAFDISPDSVASYNHNRPLKKAAHIKDLRTLTLGELDKLHGSEFRPDGVIGGPPCQGFSKGNTNVIAKDPRNQLVLVYAKIIKMLNERHPLKYFAFENVPEIDGKRYSFQFKRMKGSLKRLGFNLAEANLSALDFGTPQDRDRKILVGFNKAEYGDRAWTPPEPLDPENLDLTAAGAIKGLPEPTQFQRGLDPNDFPVHRNHWCMAPKSKRFKEPGRLKQGDRQGRSFKTLAWDKPSYTVAYGNREVHVHPNCKRRLSVFEAMLLQGFPRQYELLGTLSSQITQVSEAVPPPLAGALATSIIEQMKLDEEDSPSKTCAA